MGGWCKCGASPPERNPLTSDNADHSWAARTRQVPEAGFTADDMCRAVMSQFKQAIMQRGRGSCSEKKRTESTKVSSGATVGGAGCSNWSSPQNTIKNYLSRSECFKLENKKWKWTRKIKKVLKPRGKPHATVARVPDLPTKPQVASHLSIGTAPGTHALGEDSSTLPAARGHSRGPYSGPMSQDTRRLDLTR